MTNTSPIEKLLAYIPIDRQLALAQGKDLPSHMTGAALFADISGFTALSDYLAKHLDAPRAAEELGRYLNQAFDFLVTEVHRYHGSIISFSGDACTCWFEGDTGLAATACGLQMQARIAPLRTLRSSIGEPISLELKVAIAVGPVRRFVVGSPNIQRIDVMAGQTLERMVALEHLAGRGEVILEAAAARQLQAGLELGEERSEGEARGKVVFALRQPVPSQPWPALAMANLTPRLIHPWVLGPVRDQLRGGMREFLAELRPAAVLFLQFDSLDYEQDERVGAKLDTDIRTIQEIVNTWNGYVLQVTFGDKGSYLYATFGAPKAFEDDATRAAMAALDLQKAALTGRLKSLTGLRIGMNQGRMLTGAYGGNERRTYGVLGREVNLAARLMQAAPESEIYISEALHRDLRIFDCVALPPLQLKGFDNPVPAERLLQRRVATADLPPRLTSFVDRVLERNRLRQALAQAKTGKGQVLAFVGEAGIGKTELIKSVLDEVVPLGRPVSEWMRCVGECYSYSAQMPYSVWQSIFQAVFGLDVTATDDQKRQMLEIRLSELDPSLLARLPLLNSVLDLRLPETAVTLSLPTPIRKSSLEALLIDYVQWIAQQTPIILLLEDCQWIDQLSMQLLESLSQVLSQMPVLVLLTYRPVTQSGETFFKADQLQNRTEITLNALNLLHSHELIAHQYHALYHQQTPPNSLVERVTEVAQGNPLYIIELLNYIYSYQFDVTNQQELSDLPNSLISLILSRIDQLTSDQKSTIQIASVIGRRFQAALIWGAYPQLGGEQPVQKHLNYLEGLQLMEADRNEAGSYLFRHVLDQKVAYTSLSQEIRENWHWVIADYIERHFPAEANSALVYDLARHYGLSRDDAKKRVYFRQAGDLAVTSYANRVAIENYQKLLPLLAETEQPEVLLKLGHVLEFVGNWAQAADCYEQLLALAIQHENAEWQGQAQAALGELMRKRAKYGEAITWLEKARASFAEIGHLAGMAQVQKTLGSIANQQARPDEARQHYAASLEIWRQIGHQSSIANGLSNLGIVARSTGQLAEAQTLHTEALQIREAMNDTYAIANSLNNLGNVALDLNDFEQARSQLERAHNLDLQIGDRASIANSANNLANVIRELGDYAEAKKLYRKSEIITRALGDDWALAYLLEDVAMMQVYNEQLENAWDLVVTAQRLREEREIPLSTAEAQKLQQATSPIGPEIRSRPAPSKDAFELLNEALGVIVTT